MTHSGNTLKNIQRVSWPLMLPYAAIVRFRNFAYDHGLLQPRQLQWPVISVGNLSVGGTGKTPVVLFLADRFKTLGWQVNVLSRGYGRSSHTVARVDPEGTSDEYGDEPLMMARQGVAVYVGADRYQPGLLAEAIPGTNSLSGHRLHILDDGFQHRKLARTVDIVLLQHTDLTGRLLPAGLLREMPRSLNRADICILRAQDVKLDPDLPARVLHRMRPHDGTLDPARVWIMERRTILPMSPAEIGNAVTFCAIGDANNFFQGLRQAGVEPAAMVAFRDHHIYTESDMERLQTIARRSGARYYVTTEKDSVRIAGAARAALETVCPVLTASLDLILHEEARSIALLESMLA